MAGEPHTKLARRLIADGTIGRLAHIRAALRQTTEPDDIRRSAALAGGALSDLGCYCASAMRLFGGEPTRVHAEAVFDGVDLRFAAVLRLPDGVLGTFHAALDLPRTDELELIGTDGSLRIPDPWIGGAGHLELTRKGETTRIPVEASGDTYQIELATVTAAIEGAQPLEFGPADAVAQATAYEALARSAATGAPVSIGRGVRLERVQRVRPHVVQKGPQRGQSLAAGLVQPAGTVPALVQQTGTLQHGQMLAHRRPGHLERARDLPGGQLDVADQPEDLPPPWFGQRAKHVVEGRSYFHRPTLLPSGSANIAIWP